MGSICSKDKEREAEAVLALARSVVSRDLTSGMGKGFRPFGDNDDVVKRRLSTSGASAARIENSSSAFRSRRVR